MSYAWLGIHILGAIVCFILLIWVAGKEETDFKSTMVLSVGCCFITLISRCLYILADSLEALVLAAKMEYLGKCFVNFFALVFLLRWKKINWPKWILNLMMSVNIVAFALIVTCEHHTLYYKSFTLGYSSTSGNILKSEASPFYYFYMSYILAEIIISMIIVLIPLIKSQLTREERKIHLLLLFSALVPCMLLILRAVRIFSGDDPTILGIFFTCISWTGTISSRGLFDTVKSAKEGLVENLSEGIIVSDNNNSILYYNPAASSILKNLSVRMNFEDVKDALGYNGRGSSQVEIDGKYYETRLSEVNDKEHHVIGNMMSIIDVSNMVEQTKEMQELKERAEDASTAKSIFLSNMSHEIRTPMNAIVGMTEILLREDLDDKEKEYLMNIKSSGKSLLTIVNDILDFSKIESGKMDIIPENYETANFLNDLGMMFFNRIGSKDIDLIFDIDKRMPSVLYGDASRVRQVIINIVNNAIKFTDVGFVRLKIEIVDMNDKEATIKYSVKDTGVGISEIDINRLFRSFEQLNTRKASKQEGTGLGLSVSQRLVELMGGKIEVTSTFGVGSEFYFTLKQGIVNKKPVAEIRKRSVEKIPSLTCYIDSFYRREAFINMAQCFNLPYISYEDVVNNHEKVDYIFVDSKFYSDVKMELPSDIFDEATVCLINNPMLDNKKVDGTLATNRPLYSVNFAQMINNEKNEVEVEDEYCLNFIAPAANILLVDDNEMNRKVAIGLLKPLLMHIDTAQDGREALDMIKRNRYDIVLMDHMMPVMDGVEATKALRAMDGDYFKHLPVIALTANAVMDARKSFEEAGMDGFVAKPIELNEMVALLKKFLPADKIYKQNAEVEMNTPKESIDDIPVIDGIEIKEGIKNSGSKEMFLKMLGDYYNIIDIKSNKIEQCLNDNMIKDYVIEVHGLKSTSRLIGATKMSNEFLRMENLGNDNNIEQLKKDTPQVLKMYRSFKDKLASFASYDNKDKNDVPADELLTLLDDIKQAMDDFNLEKADEAMKVLDQCKIPEVCQKNMELLRAYVSDVAMEEVMNLCDVMAEQLKKEAAE